jgi:hypothetical protein
MANWQQIDELNDISADLPRFTDALSGLASDLGWISPAGCRPYFPALSPKRHGGALASRF